MPPEKFIDVALINLHTNTTLAEHDLLRSNFVSADPRIPQRLHDCLDERNAGGKADVFIAEGFHALNDQIGGGIKSVRFNLNDWAGILGIGLVSISQQPHDSRNSPINLNNLRDQINRRLKAQTDGLITAIDEGEPRVIVGFGVSEGAEVLRDAGGDMDRLTAAASTEPGALTLERDRERPSDKLIVPAGKIATIRALLVNERLLRSKIAEWGRSSLSYKHLPGETDAHASQRYVCEYRTTDWLDITRPRKTA